MRAEDIYCGGADIRVTNNAAIITNATQILQTPWAPNPFVSIGYLGSFFVHSRAFNLPVITNR
jgi:hypothetical protein